MIELLEGVPGSGKSYHCVAEKLLPAVRAGRRIYIYIEGGFVLGRLAAFEGVELSALEKQITVWRDKSDVLAALVSVEIGAIVFLDESQDLFRAKEKHEPEILRWLETHRHRGIDIVLMAQSYGQMALSVNRLVEVTTKFRRLDRFGLKGRYQAQVRGNPEESEIIRMYTGRYSPKVYAYYSSYSLAGIRESARGGSILKSPTVIIGLVGLVGALWFFASGHWLSVGASKDLQSVASKLPPPPPLSAESLQSLGQAQNPYMVEAPSTAVVPVHIEGGMTAWRRGKGVWLWLTSDGRFLTEDEIAAESGGTVRSRMVRGIRVLSGTGVQYGGFPAEPVIQTPLPASAQIQPVQSAPSGSVAVPPVMSGGMAPFVPSAAPGASGGQVFDSGLPDLLASPPGILATPKGIL